MYPSITWGSFCSFVCENDFKSLTARNGTRSLVAYVGILKIFNGWNPVFNRIYVFFDPSLLTSTKILLNKWVVFFLQGEQWWEANNGDTLEARSHLHRMEYEVSAGENIVRSTKYIQVRVSNSSPLEILIQILLQDLFYLLPYHHLEFPPSLKKLIIIDVDLEFSMDMLRLFKWVRYSLLQYTGFNFFGSSKYA